MLFETDCLKVVSLISIGGIHYVCKKKDYTLYGMDGSRIRTYKTINKKDYNSPWSSFRNVRTSK